MSRVSRLNLRVPCKVNLYLHVVGRRADGYHEIRTVMQAVSLYDRLAVATLSDGEIAFTCSHPDLCGEGNLVVRAARLLQHRCGVRGGARIHLWKGIPTGGGLGGGSADGALTLLALNRLWDTRLSLRELGELAAGLGSDVAFFLRGGTALCTGRGERVHPLHCSGTLHHVLVLPRLHVSTAQVYAASRTALTDSCDAGTKMIEALAAGSPERIAACLRNDLQEPAIEQSGGLARLHRELAGLCPRLGLRGLLLSGSGAAFFALAGDEEEAAHAARVLDGRLEARCVAVRSLPAYDADCMELIARRASL